MEVVLLKSGEFSFNPAEKHAVFVAGFKVNLPEDRAKYLISVNWAKEVLAEDESIASEVEITTTTDSESVLNESVHKAVVDVPDFKKQNVNKNVRNAKLHI